MKLSRLFPHEDITVWDSSGFDQYGNQTIDSPQDYVAQWEDYQGEYLDDQGNRISLDARIATPHSFEVGAIVFRGNSENHTDGTDQLYRVATKKKAKGVKGRDIRYEYGLRKWAKTLPTST